VLSAAWSPDGKRLATGSVDRTVKLWDPEDGKLLETIADHGGVVWSVAWSPEGSRLATACGDNEAREWDVSGGKAVLLPMQGRTPAEVEPF
jgi:WD40 repeat protein